MDPRRAGGAARPQPAPAAPPPAGGSRRSSRRAGGYEAPKKSNLPLILGGVGGGVLVLIVVLIIAFGGGDPVNPNPGVTNPGTGSGEVAGAPKDPQNNVKDFMTISAREKETLCRNGFLAAGKSASSHRAFWQWATDRRMSSWAAKSLKTVLDMDENDDWANEKSGRKDLRDIYAKIPDPEENDLLNTYPNQAYETLIEGQEYEKNWGTPEEYAEYEKFLREAVTHGERLKNDREYLDQQICLVNVKRHPIFSDYEFDSVARSPYVVFVERTANEKEAQRKEAKKIVERNADILETLYKKYLEVFGKRFDLPEISELERPEQRTLKVFTFFSEKSFRDYQQKIRNPIPAGVRAYYRPDDQWITLYEGQGFEKAVQGSTGTDFNTNKIFHEGFHQLMHAYTKVLMEREFGEEILYSDPRMRSRALWFQEGAAELFGSVRKLGDGTFECIVPYESRAREWFLARQRKLPEWSLKEILEVSGTGDMNRRSKLKDLGRDAGRLSSLFYAQAWHWVYFLWSHENGKYREKFLRYVKKELTGRSGSAVFKEVWDEGDDDWKKVEEEFEGFVANLWQEMGLK